MIKSSVWKTLLTIVGMLCVIGFTACPASAAEWPTIQELTGGKVKPGDVIDKSNVGLIKDLIPDGYVVQFERGMVGTIAEPGPWHTPDFFVEATKKNSGQAYIDEVDNLRTKGGVFSGDQGGWWDGGVPFPDPKVDDPKSGLQIYYNAVHAYEGDDFTHDETEPLYVGSDGKVERTIKMSWDRIYLTARELLDPKPTYAPKYKDIMFKQFAYVQWPFDLKGFGNLGIRYNDSTGYDDSYAYIPAMRRVRRLSSAQRFDAFVGSDVTLGDFRQLDVPPATWKFKLLYKKPMLAMGHIGVWVKTKGKAEDLSYPEFTEGKKFMKVPWEVIPEMYAVEGQAKNPKDCPIYSKKVTYFAGIVGNTAPNDPLHRTFRTMYSVAYDIKGELLKNCWNAWWGYGAPGKLEETKDIFYEACYGCYDIQIDHVANWPVNMPGRSFNVGFTPERFSVGYLQKFGR
jgi:hypothetical protein